MRRQQCAKPLPVRFLPSSAALDTLQEIDFAALFHWAGQVLRIYLAVYADRDASIHGLAKLRISVNQRIKHLADRGRPQIYHLIAIGQGPEA